MPLRASFHLSKNSLPYLHVLNESKQKAGAVVLQINKTGPEILLLFRAKQNDWSFPKGHIESGETPEKAMQRELKEETGLDVVVIRSLPQNFYINDADEPIILSMYLAVPVSSTQLLIAENEGDRLCWVPVDEVENVLTHQNLKDYFRAIKTNIKGDAMK